MKSSRPANGSSDAVASTLPGARGRRGRIPETEEPGRRRLDEDTVASEAGLRRNLCDLGNWLVADRVVETRGHPSLEPRTDDRSGEDSASENADSKRDPAPMAQAPMAQAPMLIRLSPCLPPWLAVRRARPVRAARVRTAVGLLHLRGEPVSLDVRRRAPHRRVPAVRHVVDEGQGRVESRRLVEDGLEPASCCTARQRRSARLASSSRRHTSTCPPRRSRAQPERNRERRRAFVSLASPRCRSNRSSGVLPPARGAQLAEMDRVGRRRRPFRRA